MENSKKIQGYLQLLNEKAGIQTASWISNLFCLPTEFGHLIKIGYLGVGQSSIHSLLFVILKTHPIPTPTNIQSKKTMPSKVSRQQNNQWDSEKQGKREGRE